MVILPVSNSVIQNCSYLVRWNCIRNKAHGRSGPRCVYVPSLLAARAKGITIVLHYTVYSRQATITMDHGSQKIRPCMTSLMLLAGCSGILFIAIFAVLGFLTPGYNSLHDTISALELTPFKLAQQINFFVFGALLCVFALGLRREMQQGFGAVLIPFIQFVDGLGVIGDAIFIRSTPHLACDLVAFNAALCVLFLFAWRFRRDYAALARLDRIQYPHGNRDDGFAVWFRDGQSFRRPCRPDGETCNHRADDLVGSTCEEASGRDSPALTPNRPATTQLLSSLCAHRCSLAHRHVVPQHRLSCEKLGSISGIVETEILLVSHPFRRGHRMDRARKSRVNPEDE